MPTLLVYPREDLPPDLNWQTLSFYRATVPGTFVGFSWFQHWMKNDDNAIHMMLIVGKL